MGVPNHEMESALRELLRILAARKYRFTTITPASHHRVVQRQVGRTARNLTDVLGWSLPFERARLPEVANYLERAGMLLRAGQLWRSQVRVSSLHEDLFFHSAFPTDGEDAVFFGPDSYRFADRISLALERRPLDENARILDIGTGAGVGAIVAGKHSNSALIHATDVNPLALQFTRINAAQAGVSVTTQLVDGADAMKSGYDFILINPPYMVDPKGRRYRDGGGAGGGRLALRRRLCRLQTRVL